MPEGATAQARSGRPRRADARRNYDQILRAAEAEIARAGADASLEEIARRAGVGSATLHRHFPSRYALLEAVFHDRVAIFCDQARELAQASDPGPALIDWLRAVAVFSASTRGLAASLLAAAQEQEQMIDRSCEGMLLAAGDDLLAAAQTAGTVRAGVAAADLLTLVNAVALATEGAADPAGQADRLLSLALEGIRP
ncbi:TetR/AcrR family transcriptional regulator [Kineosporia sp. NBRC 101731]|uniref:TetR/AcrR family transcriptional regulator n=1 Tax=Kineosporia sp. NBRC 101731 TaxID=3032199 RepID=UPI0024A3B7FB|nr:TetR/AcrR family transcriptional regulator [Kineosporia sp. NBRC 101731]GLY27245.1 TetR family transcriptional regulator [Kineosporia sp. NBRC 101731]